jgi:hypothetical protein
VTVRGQLVQGTQVDSEKWQDLRKNLRKDLDDPNAGFRLVYLIDDFAGTGTTFLRKDDCEGWKGKLMRFRESIDGAVKALDGEPIFAPDWALCIHHYVASAAAARAINQRLRDAHDALVCEGWAHAMHASFGQRADLVGLNGPEARTGGTSALAAAPRSPLHPPVPDIDTTGQHIRFGPTADGPFCHYLRNRARRISVGGRL